MENAEKSSFRYFSKGLKTVAEVLNRIENLKTLFGEKIFIFIVDIKYLIKFPNYLFKFKYHELFLNLMKL